MYNNLQLLWSSKVKFVSLSQLLGCPLFGSNSGLFTVPGFNVSLVGVKKKDGRKKRYKGKERSRTRKQEREEEGVKRKKNNKKIIIKNYFKNKQTSKQTKTSLLASNWPSQFCWSF